MTKSDLVDKVSAATGITQIDVERVIESTTGTIRQALAAGDGIYMRGFGSFTPKKRAAKTGRNITAGEPVHIPEHYIPSFKPAPRFKEALSKLK